MVVDDGGDYSMSMSSKQEYEQVIISKQISLLYMKRLHAHLKEQVWMKEKIDNSFIYLENDSLNSFLKYFMTQQKSNHSPPPSMELDELIEQIDDLLEKNKHEFEGFITSLKEKLNHERKG